MLASSVSSATSSNFSQPAEVEMAARVLTFSQPSCVLVALSVKFGGDVTGMGNVVAEETAPRANGVYNLQGVKLSNGSVEGLPAGLYIVNGRKVLVK